MKNQKKIKDRVKPQKIESERRSTKMPVYKKPPTKKILNYEDEEE